MVNLWINTECNIENTDLNIVLKNNIISVFDKGNFLFSKTIDRSEDKYIDEVFNIMINYLQTLAHNLYFSFLSESSDFLEIEKYGSLLYPGGSIKNVQNIDINGYYRIGNDLIKNSLLKIDKKSIAVKMATYQRANGSSPNYLRRSISSVINQLKTDWTMVIIGDNYHNSDELKDLIYSFNDDRIICINLPLSYERNLYTDPKKRWARGGVTAINYSILILRFLELDIVCHLDDDDLWSSGHLDLIRQGYEMNDKVTFVYSRCFYGNYCQVPLETVPIGLNNLRPRVTNIIHASMSWRLKKINFSYPQCDEAGDYSMCKLILNFIDENNLCFVYMPFTTVMKEEDNPRENSISI